MARTSSYDHSSSRSCARAGLAGIAYCIVLLLLSGLHISRITSSRHAQAGLSNGWYVTAYPGSDWLTSCTSYVVSRVEMVPPSGLEVPAWVAARNPRPQGSDPVDKPPLVEL